MCVWRGGADFARWTPLCSNDSAVEKRLQKPFVPFGNDDNDNDDDDDDDNGAAADDDDDYNFCNVRQQLQKPFVPFGNICFPFAFVVPTPRTIVGLDKKGTRCHYLTLFKCNADGDDNEQVPLFEIVQVWYWSSW